MPPAVGRVESVAFDPERWKPEYPNPAFRNLREDDAYWAAKIVARFSDATIRRIVEKARYSDPRATDYVTQTVIERRDKVLRAWLNGVLPVDDLRLSASGELTFVNTAVSLGITTPPARYLVMWHHFDNVTGEQHPVTDELVVPEEGARLPPELADADFVALSLRAVHPDHAGWRRLTNVYFRRSGDGWQTVGIERMGELPVGATRTR